MKSRKIIAAICVFIIMVLSNIFVMTYQPTVDDERISLDVTVKADHPLQLTAFFLTSQQQLSQGFTAAQAVSGEYTEAGKTQTISFSIPVTTQFIRFDPCENGESVTIEGMELTYGNEKIDGNSFSLDEAVGLNDGDNFAQEGRYIFVAEGSSDPGLIFKVSYEDALSVVESGLQIRHTVIKILLCIVLDIIFVLCWRKGHVIWEVPKEIVHNRKLIFSLAKNDFKTRFAGSYFGIIWAFVQPLVTVVVYWFVFEKALSAGAQTTRAGITVPYVLWLIAGLVPWFFFSEALNAGTNALIEYNYLVKKVVFKISILPVVKIVSSLFVHLFFIAFTLILYTCYQYYPTAYTLQMIYYSFCMIMLCLGLVYATSAIVVFFRDLTQVINIVLQVGMWVTPIMWNMDAMVGRVSSILLNVLKLNPMYYVVSGYRDALINHVWFWDRPEITVYFWVVVAIIFGIGFTIFRRLQVHFADVL